MVWPRVRPASAAVDLADGSDGADGSGDLVAADDAPIRANDPVDVNLDATPSRDRDAEL